MNKNAKNVIFKVLNDKYDVWREGKSEGGYTYMFANNQAFLKNFENPSLSERSFLFRKSLSLSLKRVFPLE